MMNLNSLTTLPLPSFEAVFGLGGKTVKGAEALAALNLKTLQASMAEFAEASRVALAAKSPDEFLKLQAAMLQQAPQKASEYGRQVAEILTAATAEQRSTAEAQLAEAQGKFLELVGGASKAAPGFENMLALAKSAVAASNNAYEGVNKVSKQVSEAVAANVGKFNEVAVKTARSASVTSNA